MTNERPTPETDEAYKYYLCENDELVDSEIQFARKLERERDEAREDAAKWESSFDAIERAGAEQARRADENREWALKAEKERDEAIERYDEISRVFDGVNEEEWKSCTTLGETVARILRERDDARKV